MSVHDLAESRRKIGSILWLRTGGRIHKSACGYDVELFQKLLGMSIRDGTDKIKVIAGDKSGTYVVTIIDKKE